MKLTTIFKDNVKGLIQCRKRVLKGYRKSIEIHLIKEKESSDAKNNGKITHIGAVYRGTYSDIPITHNYVLVYL